MEHNPLPRIDINQDIYRQLLPYCRLQPGEIWVDPFSQHRVGCLDATSSSAVATLMEGEKASLAVQDPPYNIVAFTELPVSEYIEWCRQWVHCTLLSLSSDASFYVWLGADQNHNFQPFPDFMIMLREFPLTSRSLITMRNQRGYGTQKNWMAVRQELLYYTIGKPVFNIEAEYTDIPKTLKGYYKNISGERTENTQRSKSDTIRAGNVWFDIQQVFYRMEENVSGCYAQKPLKSIERIIKASSSPGDIVVDFFSHSGTTLLAAERMQRRCFTMDIDPVFCEITIRRIENYRNKGRLGWQDSHPFAKELSSTITAYSPIQIRTDNDHEEMQLTIF